MPNLAARNRFAGACRSIVPAGVALAILVGLSPFARSQGNAGPSKTETFVVEQLLKGLPADLNRQELSGAFVEKLLARSDKAAATFPRGVRIRNARVTGEMNLSNMEIAHFASFEGCAFQAGVNLASAAFRKSLAVEGSVFLGPLSLRGAKIAGDLTAAGARFEHPEQPADFRGLHVDGAVHFPRTTFAGGADFRDTRFGYVFDLTEARFENPKGAGPARPRCHIAGALAAAGGQVAPVPSFPSFFMPPKQPEALFSRMEVAGSTLLTQAHFRGKVGFKQARLGNDFDAKDADFLPDLPWFPFAGNYHKANFESVNVRGSALLDRAKFHGAAFFGHAQFGSNFEAVEAEFTNEAVFNSMTVQQAAFFDDAKFRERADFSYAKVGTVFSANRSRFSGLALFNTVKIGTHAMFYGTVFKGWADFGYADIGLNVEMDGCQFLDKTDALNMRSIKVGAILFVTSDTQPTVWNGPATIPNAKLMHLFIQGSAEGHGTMPALDLSGTKVQGDCRIANIAIVKKADLAYSSFQKLNFWNVNWPYDNREVAPNERAEFKLDAISFEHIRPAMPQAIHDAAEREFRQLLRDFVGRAAMSATAYANLEAFYQRQGQTQLATRVFFERRWREHGQARGCFTWAGDWLLLLFVGYGAHPEWTLFWGLGFVLVGVWVFRPEKMQGQAEHGAKEEKTAPNQLTIEGGGNLLIRVFVSWNGQHRDSGSTSLPASSTQTSSSSFLQSIRNWVWNPIKVWWSASIWNAAWNAVHGWKWQPIKIWWLSSRLTYTAWWYSLDLFVPAVNLECEKHWKPKDPHWFLWLWLRFHRIAGWIIIPIGLAAITGIIKR